MDKEGNVLGAMQTLFKKGNADLSTAEGTLRDVRELRRELQELKEQESANNDNKNQTSHVSDELIQTPVEIKAK